MKAHCSSAGNDRNSSHPGNNDLGGSYQPPNSPAFNYQSINMDHHGLNNDESNPATATPTPDVIPLAPPYQRFDQQPVNDDASADVDPLAPPSASTVPAPPDEYYAKTCRICLEDDAPDTMIAPCRCKGWSRWVHRDCLDEWRLQESDRAFSKCTECLFEYYMQPIYQDDHDSARRHRRFEFCWNVSKDVCLGTLLLQLLIVALGALIYGCDRNQALPNDVMPAFQSHPWSLYYLLGWLLLLVFVGIYGSGLLCVNGCNISKSIPQFHPPSSSSTQPQECAEPTTKGTPSMSRGGPPSGATAEDRLARGVGMESTTEFYRRARHRRQRNYHHDQREGYHRNSNEAACCDSCEYCCNRQPIIIYDPYGTCYCCYCCDDRHRISSHDAECCSGCDGGGGGDGGNQDCGECVHVLLIILLALAVILAVIGFFVGIVITVVAFQRVVQRHIHLLQKKQLVQEYQVMDLQEYDLNRPLPTAPREDDLEWSHSGEPANVNHPGPSAPIEPLPAKDVSYLQKLGLKD